MVYDDDFGSIYTPIYMVEIHIPFAPLRTVYLMVLTVCLGGVFGLEQPRNSNMEFYPMFVEFLRMMYGVQQSSNKPGSGVL